MRWKQFFTPVKSIDYKKGRELTRTRSFNDLTILDVRQPGEYASGHISGAKLIPLPDLTKRMDELDPQKAIMVY